MVRPLRRFPQGRIGRNYKIRLMNRSTDEIIEQVANRANEENATFAVIRTVRKFFGWYLGDISILSVEEVKD